MLIFLDIDGVMVPAASWKAPQILEDGFPAFSQRAVNALSGIIASGDTVVLTTSHKSSYSLDDWKALFERRGLQLERLQRLDDNDSNLSRKDEVLKWFKTNTVDEAFVIIDDDRSLNALPPQLKDHLIQTSALVGLTNEHRSQAEAMRSHSYQTV